MTATIHDISRKAVRETFKELLDVREDLACARRMFDQKEVRRLRRREIDKGALLRTNARNAWRCEHD